MTSSEERKGRKRRMREAADAARDARNEALGGDLADHIQDLRLLIRWSSSVIFGALPEGEAAKMLMEIDWKQPTAFRETAAFMLKHGREDLADEWNRIADALLSEPPPAMPDDDDLLRRYRDGDLGQRTVLWLKGWTFYDLLAACQARGAHPWQWTKDEQDEIADVPDAVQSAAGRLLDQTGGHVVVLYGSRALGDATDDSDWNLCVLLSDDVQPGQFTPMTLYLLIADFQMPFRIEAMRRSVFEEKKAIPGTLAYELYRDGIIIAGQYP